MNTVGLYKPVKPTALPVFIFVMMFAVLISVMLSGCVSRSMKDSSVGPIIQKETVSESSVNALPVNLNGYSSATHDGITMSTKVGIDGIARLDSWMPVTIMLENKGESRKGYVAVRQLLDNNSGTVSRCEVDLAAGAKKRIVMNIYLNPFFNGPINTTFVSDRKPLVKTVTPYAEMQPNNEIIVAMTDDSANRQFFKDIAAETQQTKVAYMSAGELPSRATNLSAVTSIAVSGASTGALKKAQQEALSGWVASGGHLIVCGGPGWKKTVSGLPGDLMPVTPSGIGELGSYAPILEYAGADPIADPPVPIPVTTVSDITGAIVAGDKASPLIVTKSFGKGQVTWTAFDLTLQPFSSWRTNAKFWTSLQIQRNPIGVKDPLASGAGFGNDMQGALSSMPALQLSVLSWFLPYAFIYILLIGPVNFIILKRKDRKELSLITIPAIILIFGFSSFAYAYMKKGGDIVVNQIDIVEYYPGTNIAGVRSTIGILSPSKRSYVISFPENSSVAEIAEPGSSMPGNVNASPVEIEDGSHPKIIGMNIGMWSMRTLLTERYVKSAIPLDGTIRFDESGQTVVSVQNKDKNSFRDAVVVAGRRIMDVGTIEEREAFEGNITMDEMPLVNDAKDPMGEPLGYRLYSIAGRSNSESEYATMAETINSIFGFQGDGLPSTPILIAWQNKPRQEIRIAGEHPLVKDKTLYIIPLKVIPGETMVFPLGSLSRNLIESKDIAYNESGFILNNSAATFRFIIPPNNLPPNKKSYTVTKLVLHSSGIHSDSGNPLEKGRDAQSRGYSITLYNYKTKAWKEIDSSSDSVTIPDAAQYVSPDGRIMAQISTTMQNISISVFDFEVHGTWLN